MMMMEMMVIAISPPSLPSLPKHIHTERQPCDWSCLGTGDTACQDWYSSYPLGAYTPVGEKKELNKETNRIHFRVRKAGKKIKESCDGE